MEHRRGHKRVQEFGGVNLECIEAFKCPFSSKCIWLYQAPMEAPGFQVSPEFHRPLPQGADSII